MKYFKYNNIDFIVGENDKDNWKIILESNKEYIWLHAHNIPSAHVIIEIDTPLVDEMKYACELCKKQTKINAQVEYIYTKIKNIKLGNKAGEVVIKNMNDVNKIIY
jgi:predicted ribosome quality control (RQC) complex YloA/Tae2 family protein